MAETFPILKPQAKFGMNLASGFPVVRNDDADEWEAGDFLELASGTVTKCEEATPANVGPLVIALQPSNQFDDTVDRDDVLAANGFMAHPIPQGAEWLWEVTLVGVYAANIVGTSIDFRWSSTSGYVAGLKAVDDWRRAYHEPAMVAVNTTTNAMFRVCALAPIGNNRVWPAVGDTNVRVVGYFDGVVL